MTRYLTTKPYKTLKTPKTLTIVDDEIPDDKTLANPDDPNASDDVFPDDENPNYTLARVST